MSHEPPSTPAPRAMSLRRIHQTASVVTQTLRGDDVFSEPLRSACCFGQYARGLSPPMASGFIRRARLQFPFYLISLDARAS